MEAGKCRLPTRLPTFLQVNQVHLWVNGRRFSVWRTEELPLILIANPFLDHKVLRVTGWTDIISRHILCTWQAKTHKLMKFVVENINVTSSQSE